MKTQTYQQALEKAKGYLDLDGMEVRSALKQGAVDCGIQYGDEMEQFVIWAEEQLKTEANPPEQKGMTATESKLFDLLIDKTARLIEDRDIITNLTPEEIALYYLGGIREFIGGKTATEATESKPVYILKYREQGKRPNTTRWAKRKVASVREATDWMNANKETAFAPAFVETNSWTPETVAILG